MVIIIEGSNFTSKTTFLESLNGKYPIYRGLASLPSSTIKLHSLSDVIASDLYAADFIRQTNTNVIFERSPLSAVIYDGLPLQYYLEWEKLINTNKTVMLIFWVPSEVLIDRMLEPEAQDRMTLRGLTKQTVINFNASYKMHFANRNVSFGIKTYLINTTVEKELWLANHIVEINFKENK